MPVYYFQEIINFFLPTVFRVANEKKSTVPAVFLVINEKKSTHPARSFKPTRLLEN